MGTNHTEAARAWLSAEIMHLMGEEGGKVSLLPADKLHWPTISARVALLSDVLRFVVSPVPAIRGEEGPAVAPIGQGVGSGAATPPDDSENVQAARAEARKRGDYDGEVHRSIRLLDLDVSANDEEGTAYKLAPLPVDDREHVRSWLVPATVLHGVYDDLARLLGKEDPGPWAIVYGVRRPSPLGEEHELGSLRYRDLSVVQGEVAVRMQQPGSMVRGYVSFAHVDTDAPWHDKTPSAGDKTAPVAVVSAGPGLLQVRLHGTYHILTHDQADDLARKIAEVRGMVFSPEGSGL